MAILLATQPAAAQSLGTDQRAFTVNGRAAFLLFISYFDGVRRIPDSLTSTRTLDTDLDTFVSKDVSGIRVFPNWQFPGETLMACDGSLRPPQLRKLKILIERAAVKNLVVDVSFTLDTVRDAAGRQCLEADAYKAALEHVTRELAPYRNALFDLQNEHDKNLPPVDARHARGWSAAEWRDYLGHTIVPALKQRDPHRLMTVSWTSDADPAAVFDAVQRYGYDVLAYHARGPRWEEKTSQYVTALRAMFTDRGPTRPIYFQEPNRVPFDDNADHYLRALANAKAAGAAAWTFHNSVVERSKPLNGSTPFEQLLDPRERVMLDGMRAVLTR